MTGETVVDPGESVADPGEGVVSACKSGEWLHVCWL